MTNNLPDVQKMAGCVPRRKLSAVRRYWAPARGAPSGKVGILRRVALYPCVASNSQLLCCCSCAVLCFVGTACVILALPAAVSAQRNEDRSQFSTYLPPGGSLLCTSTYEEHKK